MHRRTELSRGVACLRFHGDRHRAKDDTWILEDQRNGSAEHLDTVDEREKEKQREGEWEISKVLELKSGDINESGKLD